MSNFCWFIGPGYEPSKTQKNVAIWVCTPKSDVDSEEKKVSFWVETEDQNGEKNLSFFFREKTLVAKMATKAKTLVAKRKIQSPMATKTSKFPGLIVIHC